MSVMNKLPSNYDESDGSIYVYNQLNEPENKNGIWIKSTDSVNVVQSVYSNYFIQYNNPINYGRCWGIIGSINDNLYAICRTGDAYYNYKFNLLKYNNGNVTIIDTMRGSYLYSGIYNNKFITYKYGYKKFITVDSNGANTLDVEIPNYDDYELFLINGEPYVIAMHAVDGFNIYDILKISSSGNITTTNRFQYTYASSYDHYASHITSVYYYNSKLYISMYSEFGNGVNGSVTSVGIINEILVYNPSTNSIENTLEAIDSHLRKYSISDFIEYNNNLYCIGGTYIFKLNNNSLVFTNMEIFGVQDMFLYKGKLYLYGDYLFGLPDPCTIIVSIGYTYIIANINKNDFEWSMSPVSYYGSNSKFQDVEIYYGDGTKWNKCTLYTNNL